MQQQLDQQTPIEHAYTHIADAQSAEQSQEATSSQPELPQLRKALQQRLGQRLTGVQFILSRERVLWRRGWLAMPQVSHITTLEFILHSLPYERVNAERLRLPLTRLKHVNETLRAVRVATNVLGPPQVVPRLKECLEVFLVRLTALEAVTSQPPLISGRYTAVPYEHVLKVRQKQVAL